MDDKLAQFMKLQYDRVGLLLRPEMIAVKDVERRCRQVCRPGQKGHGQDRCRLILLCSDKADVLKAGAEAAKDRKPLLGVATPANADAFGALAKEMGLALVAKADGYDALAELTTKLTGMGLKDLVIDTGSPGPETGPPGSDRHPPGRPDGSGSSLSASPPSPARAEMTDDPMMEKLYAAVFIAKYGGIVVVNDLSADGIFPLLLERLNIFTDPQKPMIITPGIYEIGTPDENSPVAVTTNFALTYFIVSGEIEASKVPTWLLIQDTEGLSVMTAWAAGKFSGDSVAHVREEMRHHG